MKSSWERQTGPKLRPECEMDNFSCSHRCTSNVRLWSGARSVLRTPTRPASSLSRFMLLSTSFTPVMVGFVFPDLLYLLFGPKTNPDSSHRLNRRNRKFLLPYPTAERVPTDAYKFCDFNGRVSRHSYNRIGLYVLSSTKLGSGCRQPMPRLHPPRRVSQLLQEIERRFSHCRFVKPAG